MGYFRELPNLEYESPLSDKISSSSYIRAKNLFRRMKVRDDLQNTFTLFDKYQIVDGLRPDNVAEELYGKASLDWVVILTAGIVNIRNEWPLSSKDLYDYTAEKYGSTKVNEIHHYETKEIKNSSDVIVLPKGMDVNSNFTFTYYDSTEGMVTKSSEKAVAGISNYEYEVRKNSKKQTIYVLKKEYLQQFLTDMRNGMIYKKSSQYVNDKLIRVENTRITT